MPRKKWRPRLSELSRRIYLSGGMRVNFPGWPGSARKWKHHLQRVRESISEIDSIGVQVKDLDTGLLDFPFRLDEDIVLFAGAWASRPSSTGIRWSRDSRGARRWTSGSGAVRLRVEDRTEKTGTEGPGAGR